jgi:hypothetical protein
MDFDTYAAYRDKNILNRNSSRIKSNIDELSKLNDNQLENELQRQITLKKQNGTIGDIEKLIKTINPYLNNEQKQRLERIIKQWK